MMFTVDVPLTAKVRSRAGDMIEELTALLARRGIESVRGPDGTVAFRGVDGDLTLRPTRDGAILELRRLDTVDEDNEAGWVGEFVLAPLVQSLEHGAVADWITDRWARRPTGSPPRAGYPHPRPPPPDLRAGLD